MKARIAAVAIISTVSSVIVPVAAHAADGCTQPVEVAAETLQQAINQVSNPLSVREDAAKRGLTSLTDEEKQLRALLQETQYLIHMPGNTCKYVDENLLDKIDGLIDFDPLCETLYNTSV